MSLIEHRPRCPTCHWELSDQEIAGGICLACGADVTKEPRND